MAKGKFKKIIAVFVIGGFLIGAGTSVNAYAQSAKTSSLKSFVENFKVPGHKAISSDEMAKKMKTDLDPLVKSGTITQAQEDKIISYMKTKYDEKKAEMDKVKNMTDTERKAYFESKNKNRASVLKELVDSKVITQSQADEVRKAVGHKGFKGEKDPTNRINGIKNTLDSAVKDGTITQVQEDKILAYMNQIKENRKAEKEKIKAMTEAERKAYFENRDKTAKPDIFSELVKSGTITQTQADKLKSMMPANPKGPGYEKHGNKKINN